MLIGMRQKWKEIRVLLSTPHGRRRLALALLRRLCWGVRGVAWVYRRVALRRTRIVAVIGTYGKTTTTRSVAAALGLPYDHLRGKNSGTALALAVLRIRPWAPFAVVEVGIAGPRQMWWPTSLLRPAFVVVTSIGSEHHTSFGTLQATRREKSTMIRSLPKSGIAFLNGDDRNVLWMRGETAARAVTFGFQAACDVRADEPSFDGDGTMRCAVHAGQRRYDLTTRLLGRHMVYPLLAAVAVGIEAGVDPASLVRALNAMAPSPERLEPIRMSSGAILLVDTFKALIETIEAAFDTLAAVPATRRMMVLGDIEEPKGSQGPLYREIGSRAARVASAIVFVGGGKAFRSLRAGAAEAGLPKASVLHVGRSPRRAAELLRGRLQPGDVLLIKGRSTQQLERVALHLLGARVACDVPYCSFKPGCRFCSAGGTAASLDRSPAEDAPG